MKIAILAANGKLGKLLVKEAVAKKVDVTAIARRENQTVASNFIKKDIFDLTKTDLASFDVIISAFGVSNEQLFYMHSEVIEHLTQLLSNTSTRLIVAGGAGSLYMDKNRTTRWVNTPDFPDEVKSLAVAEDNSFSKLKNHKNVNWTYVSPPAELQLDRSKKGQYIVASDYFMTNNTGKNVISYADYAAALIDEALSQQAHIKQHISFLEK